jgi:hypothetical protein
MAPAQAIRQPIDGCLIRPQLRKSQHAEQVGAAEAISELSAQLSRQCRDNFLAVLGAFPAEHLFLNPMAYAPVEHNQFFVDGPSNALAHPENQTTQLVQQQWVRWRIVSCL